MNAPLRPYAGGGLFLDRDGTLNIDIHHLHDPDQLELIPGTREALMRAIDLGFRLYLFTNQSGINRGYFTIGDVLACNRRLIELIGLGDGLFSAVCIAPETPDEPSPYRKPSPRFILESIEADKLKPELCYMVGDRLSDWQAGTRAGIKAVAVRSGKPLCAESLNLARELQVPCFDCLLDWVRQIPQTPHP